MHDPNDNLSHRELEILRMIRNGFDRESISRKLVISKLTYDTHRRNIRSKLNIKNQADWAQVLWKVGEPGESTARAESSS